MLMAVYKADERHRLTTRFHHVVETEHASQKIQSWNLMSVQGDSTDSQ
jgi:hypothetical protein